MRFSERIGKRPVKAMLQVEAIDLDLLNRLWSITLENFFDKLQHRPSYIQTQKINVCKDLWKDFFIYPIDTIPKPKSSNIVDPDTFIFFL